MAITFPRSLPYTRFMSFDFRLQEQAAVNLLYGGQTEVEIRSPARWLLTAETMNLPDDEWREWMAWLDSLRGGLNAFYCSDVINPYPVTYQDGFGSETRHGGGGFDGTGVVDSLTATSVTISTLPTSFALKAGDLVGLIQAATTDEPQYNGLFRITEDATAALGVVTLSIAPPIPTTLFDANATVQFDSPVCVMNLVHGSRRTMRRGGLFHSIAFEATQKVA